MSDQMSEPLGYHPPGVGCAVATIIMALFYIALAFVMAVAT